MNSIFKLKEPNTEKETLIYFRSFFSSENKNFIYFPEEKIKPSERNFEKDN